jgi:16S rRNA (cytosine967-C5)-methyltransferase
MLTSSKETTLPDKIIDESDERWLALKGLNAVFGRDLTLDQVEQDQPLPPLTREILYGTCRHFFSLEAALEARMQKPLRRKDQDVWALLMMGAYQVLHTRVPPHAAVHTSVALVQKLRKPWAKALVNAVLRGLVRDQEAAEHSPEEAAANTESNTLHHDHPEWLAQALLSQYPESATALMLANNQRAPMALRVNIQRSSPTTLLAELDKAGHEVSKGYLPETLLLAEPTATLDLPKHADGHFSIQDAGAQLANACWSETKIATTRLLDACAAPGGKLHHAIERLQPESFVALELQPARLAALQLEAQRLGHDKAQGIYTLGDATTLTWWDGIKFDRILLDAPCSGTGTLRRHPDIKLHPADIPAQASKQLALLTNLWQTLQDGGELLYCTCSLLREENDSILAQFIAQQTDAAISRFELPSGTATDYGWQLTPLDPATDGFYYARLQRGSPSTQGEQK